MRKFITLMLTLTASLFGIAFPSYATSLVQATVTRTKPSFTSTALPTYTQRPTYTFVPTYTPRPTYTFVPTYTPRPTYTFAPTYTPRPTQILPKGNDKPRVSKRLGKKGTVSLILPDGWKNDDKPSSDTYSASLENEFVFFFVFANELDDDSYEIKNKLKEEDLFLIALGATLSDSIAEKMPIKTTFEKPEVIELGKNKAVRLQSKEENGIMWVSTYDKYYVIMIGLTVLKPLDEYEEDFEKIAESLTYTPPKQ